MHSRSQPRRPAVRTILARFARSSRAGPDRPARRCRAIAMFTTSGLSGGPSDPFNTRPPARRRLLRAIVSDDELPHAWRRIQQELRHAVGESTWHIWLEPLTARSLDAGVLVVEAPDAIRSWVGGRFSRVLRACAEAVLGPGVQVDLVAPGEGVRPTGPAPPPQGAVIAGGSAFNPRFTFDQFVIGDGNRLAHAAALAVAELPGLAYNPLFICGPPGLGKTHLLHSIANYVRDHGGGLSVLYTTAEAFTDQFVGALQSGAIEAFKTAYRHVDVLLVDDVQFLVGKARTEQEFFHTF